jgi:hypothetical protein
MPPSAWEAVSTASAAIRCCVKPPDDDEDPVRGASIEGDDVPPMGTVAGTGFSGLTHRGSRLRLRVFNEDAQLHVLGTGAISASGDLERNGPPIG